MQAARVPGATTPVLPPPVITALVLAEVAVLEVGFGELLVLPWEDVGPTAGDVSVGMPTDVLPVAPPPPPHAASASAHPSTEVITTSFTGPSTQRNLCAG